MWDLPTATCKLVLQAKAVSCLAFCAAANVFAAGFHDVGRTQVWSSVSWQPLQTLGGHLHGIRAIDINERYLVSAGADKGLSNARPTRRNSPDAELSCRPCCSLLQPSWSPTGELARK